MSPAMRPNRRQALAGTTPLIRVLKSRYAADYFGLALLLATYILIDFFAEPFHRMFYINDLNISFPHANIERVPVGLNIVYGLFIPLLAMLLYNMWTGASIHKHHVTILGIGISLGLASVVTDIVKNMVGRPRPDLLARCKPSLDTPRDTLVSFDICTEKNARLLHDGWRSFPSGHSSFAFAGLGYASLFLAGQLGIFVLKSNVSSATATAEGRQDHTATMGKLHIRGELWKTLVSLAPLLGAAMIAISRCQDYRHDVYDVSVGALLGWIVANWSYRRYWPRLTSIYCNAPYPSPEPSKSPAVIYGQLEDVEGDNAV